MSAIQKQIDAAKYAKRILKTINEKVPDEIRKNVVQLITAELSQPANPTGTVEAETPATGNPLG